MLKVLINPKCSASMEVVRSEMVTIQMDSGQIIYENRILTQNFCSSQSRNPNHNHNRQPKNIRTVSVTPMSLFILPWFSRQDKSEKVYFPNQSPRCPAAHLQLLHDKELPIKTYLQVSPFFTIKLSHSPACL